MNHPLDTIAETIFRSAIRDSRCGELLEALFNGGSATVDGSTGELVIVDSGAIDLMRQDDSGY